LSTGNKRSRKEYESGGNDTVSSAPSKKKRIEVDEKTLGDISGLLIGPQGSFLQKMESDSGAQIRLRGGTRITDEQDPEYGEPLTVVITAETTEAMDKASAIVTEILNDPDKRADIKAKQLAYLETSGKGLDQAHVEVKIMKVPGNTVGLIIGRAGATIEMLQSQTGCNIQVAGNDTEINGIRDVTLKGSADQVKHAEAEVLKLVSRDNDRGDRM
jgi:predicted RNA-binding protein Jag